MLMQTIDSALVLFPAMPTDTDDVSFTTLRATGAYDSSRWCDRPCRQPGATHLCTDPDHAHSPRSRIAVVVAHHVHRKSPICIGGVW